MIDLSNAQHCPPEASFWNFKSYDLCCEEASDKTDTPEKNEINTGYFAAAFGYDLSDLAGNKGLVA